MRTSFRDVVLDHATFRFVSFEVGTCGDMGEEAARAVLKPPPSTCAHRASQPDKGVDATVSTKPPVSCQLTGALALLPIKWKAKCPGQEGGWAVGGGGAGGGRSGGGGAVARGMAQGGWEGGGWGASALQAVSL